MAMPLSTTYFNWETSMQTTTNYPELMRNYYSSFFHEETLPPPPLDYYSDHESFFFLNNNNNPNSSLFDYYYPPQYQTPPLLFSDYNISMFPNDDQSFQYPCPNKRHKLSFEDDYPLPYCNDNYFCDGLEDNFYPYCCSSLMPEFNDIGGVPPSLQLPVVAGAVRTVSAQGVVARERRKKIAEKTQELGKMVPGGSKMNTAEMLLAASKYVKYLQAQVSMLQLMNTLTEDKESTGSDNEDEQLQAMLDSASVEEKLYLQEKCLAPQHLVTTLTNHSDIQTKPSILKNLNELIIVTDTDHKKKQLQ